LGVLCNCHGTHVSPLAINHAQAAAAKIFSTIDRLYVALTTACIRKCHLQCLPEFNSPTIDSASEEGRKLDRVTGAITLTDVHFRYPSRPDVAVLKGLSISFAPGQTSAFVGASGSGKSTIISLVERFYDPLSGSVKLDGVDLRELNVKWLRGQIGLVIQEPTLFATTIRGNVAHGLVGTPWEYADADEKFKMIKIACIKANADQFIEKFPEGYDTNVGERGFLLSGGQKQRIAIARAIASDPAILLLDEATSALDTQSEGIVQDALNKASEGRTTITVAHRLSTIKDANCIYVMRDGALVESGTHDELLRDQDGAYARLVNAQKLREESQPSADDGLRGEVAPLAVNGGGPAIAVGSVADSDTGESVKSGTFGKSGNVVDIVPGLARVSTSGARSLASKVLGNKLKKEKEGTALSTTYLFRRMAGINGDGVHVYAFGAMAAIGMFFFLGGALFCEQRAKTFRFYSQLLGCSTLYSELVRLEEYFIIQ
jgi:ATP-binding cassette subfamily B (MDR/TAP) protein 1